MSKSLKELLAEHLETYTIAKNPINPEIFGEIPFFNELFPKDVWPLLVKMGGNDGIAYIELKKIAPRTRIIQKGVFDMMVYWLIDGEADVMATIGKRKTIVKKYNEQGHCFGEMAIIDENERTADVYTCSDKGATILEIDWSITGRVAELEKRFNKLLLKTVSKKLQDSYALTKKAYLALINMKNASDAQLVEIAELRAKLENHGVDAGEQTSMDLTGEITAITDEITSRIGQP